MVNDDRRTLLSNHDPELCLPLKDMPSEVSGDFTRCFWILEKYKGQAFSEVAEAHFLEELDTW